MGINWSGCTFTPDQNDLLGDPAIHWATLRPCSPMKSKTNPCSMRLRQRRHSVGVDVTTTAYLSGIATISRDHPKMVHQRALRRTGTASTIIAAHHPYGLELPRSGSGPGAC